MSLLRAIEKAIRRTTLSILGGSGVIGPDDALPAPLPTGARILLIRIDRIGDAIISTPVLRSLRERFPEGQIDILLGEKNRAVASLLPDVDNTYVLGKKAFGAVGTIRALRRNDYHAVVNLHLNRSASASVVSRLAGADAVIESARENAFAGSDGMCEHVVSMTSHLLKPFGIEPITETNEREHPLRLLRPAEPSRKVVEVIEKILSRRSDADRVVINVSARHVARQWSTGHFIALAGNLLREGMIPIICGAPGDVERVREIARASGAHALPSMAEYADFASLIAHADVVVTPDTSTVHLAAATGRPTVAFYSCDHVERTWRPWGVPFRTLVGTGGIERIRPEDVASAVRQLLGSDKDQQTERTEIPTRSV